MKTGSVRPLLRSPAAAIDRLSERRRGIDTALWAAPPAIALAVYWQGLFCELQQDDFAWLGLRLQMHSLSDWPRALFEPLAQGTVRPLSERLFFIVYSGLFGTWALPYRLTAFLFQTLNLLLLNAVGRKLTGSPAAGCFAALLWTANAALAVPMSWSSAFNQIACACCIFGAFHFLLRFEAGGRKRDLRRQWALYLLGFGALEIIVVYPALATAYAALCAPKLLRRTVPLWLPATAYAALRAAFAGSGPAGPYAPDWSVSSMAAVLVDFWGRVLGPAQLRLVSGVEPWFGPAGTVLLTAALAGFALSLRRGGRKDGLFLLAWFVIAAAPYLPLGGQRMAYYPFSASAGISLLAGWGLQTALNRSPRAAAGAAALVCLYLLSSLPVGRAQMFYYYVRGQRVKPLVEGVVETRRRHPQKTIYLAGVDEPLFWGAVYDRPFRLWNVSGVYLLPDDDDGGGTERYRAARPRFERAPQEKEQAIILRLDGTALESSAND